MPGCRRGMAADALAAPEALAQGGDASTPNQEVELEQAIFEVEKNNVHGAINAGWRVLARAHPSNISLVTHEIFLTNVAPRPFGA